MMTHDRVTLETFRASRVETDDLSATFPGQDMEDRPGYVYLNGHFWIEAVTCGEHAGRFWTLCENDDVLGSLAECEAWLFERVVEDGREIGR